MYGRCFLNAMEKLDFRHLRLEAPVRRKTTKKCYSKDEHDAKYFSGESRTFTSFISVFFYVFLTFTSCSRYLTYSSRRVLYFSHTGFPAIRSSCSSKSLSGFKWFNSRIYEGKQTAIDQPLN